jgi:endonuclease YncB( thermonuclease family)
MLSRVVLGLALAAWPGAAATAAEVLPGPVAAEVLAVPDGDTLVVRARIWIGQAVEVKVRLAGIDAPEMKGRCESERALARAARDRLARSAAVGGTVTLTDIRYGKYAGRVLARISDGAGADLGAALVAAGLARPYSGGRRTPWCPRTAAR